MSASGIGHSADSGRFDGPAEARRWPLSSSKAARVRTDESNFQTFRLY